MAWIIPTELDDVKIRCRITEIGSGGVGLSCTRPQETRFKCGDRVRLKSDRLPGALTSLDGSLVEIRHTHDFPVYITVDLGGRFAGLTRRQRQSIRRWVGSAAEHRDA